MKHFFKAVNKILINESHFLFYFFFLHLNNIHTWASNINAIILPITILAQRITTIIAIHFSSFLLLIRCFTKKEKNFFD